MPIGSDTSVLETIPGQPYVSDPAVFTQLTRPNVAPFSRQAHPGAGGTLRAQVPQVGILSRLRLTFSGELTVAVGGTTAGTMWPHGLLASFLLSLNGQDKLFAVDGNDLHALRFARNPAYEEDVDVAPPAGAIAAGTHALDLGWEVPVAMDETSLVGAIYAQSSATIVALEAVMAADAALFTANPGNASIDGTWTLEHRFYAVPRDPQSGRLVVPDLSRLHAYVAVDVPVSAAGEAPAPLIRSAGQLTRLFTRTRKSSTEYLSADPATAAASLIDAWRLEYGGNERPFVYDPASSLVRQNNQHYGLPLPYSTLCLDLVRDNPTRDALLLQGTTELKAVQTLNSAVVPAAGANVHLVQETLY